MLRAGIGEGPTLEGHLANHFESTRVRESGMLVGVHPAVFLKDWGFGDFQSLRTNPGGHPIQPIEASHLVLSLSRRDRTSADGRALTLASGGFGAVQRRQLGG